MWLRSIVLLAAACGTTNLPPGGPDAAGGADAAASPDGAPPDAAGPPGWTLVWQDEFEGAAGTPPDPTKWVSEVGGGGWGNNELEFYTARTENAALDGAGALAITAIEEPYMGRDYTSARLKTQGIFDQTYGRFEARIKVPGGLGLWPAFWMLGNDIGSVGWPGCGEIDVMENIGREPSTIHGTIHGPGYSGGAGLSDSFELPDGGLFASDFHVFVVEWEAAEIRFYLDGALYGTQTPADLPAGTAWVYDHPFFMLLNLAVGGTWPGPPDATTPFPAILLVDYVRVYSR